MENFKRIRDLVPEKDADGMDVIAAVNETWCCTFLCRASTKPMFVR